MAFPLKSGRTASAVRRSLWQAHPGGLEVDLEGELHLSRAGDGIYDLAEVTVEGVEFRWEVFNATNTANFDIPNLDISVSNIPFGQILDTITNPRLMQFALKINF